MLEFKTGNLLESDVEALVNTVNTMGIMGKGIALQFKQAYPDNFTAYQKAVKNNDVLPGRMFIYETGRLTNPRYIINFPTKRNWRAKARLEDIKTGLDNLVEIIKQKNISSIAIPPLGCGFGGLNWSDVKPLIITAMDKISGIKAWVFIPLGEPAPEKMLVGTHKPQLTLGRAAMIELISRYALPGYSLTMLEIQKLAYFLQSSGENLKLNFTKRQFGPYAENLHFVLQRMEGHYLRGYGSRSGNSNIHLMPGAHEEAIALLISNPMTQKHLERVSDLIKGFETPYGMELLATVHWLSRENPNIKNNYQHAIDGFMIWNKRKKEHFRKEHIITAWKKLRQENWL